MSTLTSLDVTHASEFAWREIDDDEAWDRALAKLGGHPLQSALWGNARRHADGVGDRRLMLIRNGEPAMMVRMELRKVPLLGGLVGWVPRGPAVQANCTAEKVASYIHSLPAPPLLIVTDLWRRSASSRTPRQPETLWIDLSVGEDALWKRLDKRVRHSIRKAIRDGVTIEQSRSPSDLDAFLALLRQLRATKGFEAALSPEMYGPLLESTEKGSVTATVFVARLGLALTGAALILRSGPSIHYFSGGTDRAFGKLGIGETLHWSIIQWAIAEGVTLYDMEGIDAARNPGTFAFKKKFGGDAVPLAGKEYYASSALGRMIATLDRFRDGPGGVFRSGAATRLCAF